MAYDSNMSDFFLINIWIIACFSEHADECRDILMGSPIYPCTAFNPGVSIITIAKVSIIIVPVLS